MIRICITALILSGCFTGNVHHKDTNYTPKLKDGEIICPYGYYYNGGHCVKYHRNEDV